jgi:preprotein translocase subunit SecD
LRRAHHVATASFWAVGTLRFAHPTDHRVLNLFVSSRHKRLSLFSREEDAMRMTVRTTLKALTAALLLASATLPALAASDAAKDVDRMQAKVAAAAENALMQQGGSRIVLKVDADGQREAMLTQLRDDVYRIVREDKIPFSALATRDGGVEIKIADAKDRARVAAKLAPPAEGSHGIAITDAGDGSLHLAATDAAFADHLHELVRDSMPMIEELLRDGGIKFAGEAPDGADRIRVSVPGVSDPDRVVAMLTRKRQVAFRLVDITMTPELALKGNMPEQSEVVYGLKDKAPYLLQKEAVMSGEDVSDVAPGYDPATKLSITSFRFNARGARRLAHVTQENVGRPFAIVLDDAVLSAPVIREPITGGSLQLSGNLTVQEASNIAMLLRSGTPAGRLSVVSQEVIAPKR